MSAKKISVDKLELELSISSLEKQLKELQGITLSLSSRSSKSDAMDEFAERATATSFLMARYTGLLCRDIKQIRKGIDSLDLADLSAAKSIAGK